VVIIYLKELTTMCDNKADRPAKADASTEAPLPKITPAMIAAVSEVLDSHYLGDGVYDLREETVVAMIRSALLARGSH
jgi:hypothetical protein